MFLNIDDCDNKIKYVKYVYVDTTMFVVDNAVFKYSELLTKI